MEPKSFKDAMHTDLAGLERIIKSPYERGNSAEVGERLFEYTQSLIDPERGLGSGSGSTDRKSEEGPSDEAIEVFGKDQAKIILETSRRVSLSGMLYACGWTDGIMYDGYNCGRLQKELLLLCLCDHRIANGDNYGTKCIVKDLDVWKMVSDALSLWNLKEKFPRLAQCDNINSFERRRNHCFKCIIFLARAMTCMKYLEWNFLAISDDTSLKTKIYACLGILESSVTIVEQKKKVAKKLLVQKAKPVTEGSTLGSRFSKCLIHNTNNSNEKLGNMPINGSNLCHDKDYKKYDGSDLSRRLRCKDSKIVGIRFHSEPLKSRRTTDMAKEHDPGHEDKSKEFIEHKKKSLKSNSSDLSRRLRCKDSKIVGIRFHSEPLKSRRTTDMAKEHDPSPEDKSKEPVQPKKKESKFSHALFDTTRSTDTKFVNVPKTFALGTKDKLPTYVSDGSSMQSGPSDSNFWYPVDKKEFILNSIQIEMAWLVEESMYCRRNTKVDWIYLMKYASPALQSKLRQISDVVGPNDEEIIRRLLQSGIEFKRFAVLRIEIKRKLLKSVVRTRMEGILPRLRMASHPLRRKKMQSK